MALFISVADVIHNRVIKIYEKELSTKLDQRGWRDRKKTLSHILSVLNQMTKPKTCQYRKRTTCYTHTYIYIYTLIQDNIHHRNHSPLTTFLSPISVPFQSNSINFNERQFQWGTLSLSLIYDIRPLPILMLYINSLFKQIKQGTKWDFYHFIW